MSEKSEELYQFLYDFSPIALCEADYSEVKKCIQQLKKTGITDFRCYFQEYPEALVYYIDKVRLMHMNRAMVMLLDWREENQTVVGLRKIFTDDTLQNLREWLIAYAEGRDSFESEVMIQTFGGTKRHLVVKWSAVPGFEESKTIMLNALIDITELRRAEEELEARSRSLEEANIALRVLTNNGEKEREAIREKVGFSIRMEAKPFIERLKKSGLTREQKVYIEILEPKLNRLIEPVSNGGSNNYKEFTPSELNIATLIKEGKRTKEISEILHLSMRTVEAHRQRIRKKLKLINQRANLCTVLLLK